MQHDTRRYQRCEVWLLAHITERLRRSWFRVRVLSECGSDLTQHNSVHTINNSISSTVSNTRYHDALIEITAHHELFSRMLRLRKIGAR
jgi:hypothetical protein